MTTKNTLTPEKLIELLMADDETLQQYIAELKAQMSEKEKEILTELRNLGLLQGTDNDHKNI
jgi:hypothetical protein